MVMMDWCEISVKSEKNAVEAVAGMLMDSGAGGVSIEDPFDINRYIEGKAWDAYHIPGEIRNRDYVLISAYLPIDSSLDERLSLLREGLNEINKEFFPGAITGIDFSEVREEDWANSWKAYYKPVRIGSRIVIKPTWEDFKKDSSDLVIELDPGMAFGTGTHPTTVMCIKFLEEIIEGRETVFDIGTGSGILAIGAALLGAQKVTAVDIDRVAVNSAEQNVSLNNLADKVDVIEGNLLDQVSGTADVVIANIVADVIINICPDAARVVRRGGVFVASGIIDARVEDVFKAARDEGFVIKKVSREGDWVAFLAVRED